MIMSRNTKADETIVLQNVEAFKMHSNSDQLTRTGSYDLLCLRTVTNCVLDKTSDRTVANNFSAFEVSH